MPEVTQTVDDLVYMIAQAINGPYDFQGHFDEPDNRYTLKELRGARWVMLSSNEQSIRILEARSVVRTLEKKGIDLYDLCKITRPDSGEAAKPVTS